MLITKCINPLLVYKTALCGHGDKILIADGNYPLESMSGSAETIHLALSENLPTVEQVLQALMGITVFERADVMLCNGAIPATGETYRKILELPEIQGWPREEFYQNCMLPNLRLAISTGDKRQFANLLLTVGCA